MHTSKGAEGGQNALEGRYLQTVSYTRTRLNEKLVGRTVLDKKKRNIGLRTDCSFESDELQLENTSIYLCP